MEDKLKKAVKVYDKVAEIYSNRHYHQLMQFQLTKFCTLLQGKKVLDVGCGPGRDVEYLIEEGYDVIGIDLSESMIKEAKKNVPKGKFKIMDFREMSFKNNSFDGIWSMAALYHVNKKELKNVLKEFNRVLNKKGVLYLAVKEGSGNKEIEKPHYNEKLHFYFYPRDEMETSLEKANFSLINSEVNTTEDGKRWLEVFARKK